MEVGIVFLFICYVFATYQLDESDYQTLLKELIKSYHRLNALTTTTALSITT